MTEQIEPVLRHWIILTDTNSRQYNFEITELGFEVVTPKKSFTVTLENKNLPEFNSALYDELVITIDNTSVFNTRHLIAVEYKKYY